MKSELEDYTLWYDGTIEVHPEKLVSLLLDGVDASKLSTTDLSDDIKKFNKLSYDCNIGIKTANNIPEKSLLIPHQYLQLDLDKYIESKILPNIRQDSFYEERLRRLVLELKLFEQHGLLYLLKVMIYVVDEFKKQKVVWGVGRGSSCASYLLFLIGLHSIDSVRYGIPITEFIKENKEWASEQDQQEDKS